MNVGFYVEKVTPYEKAMASTRLRAHDPIRFLNRHSWEASFYEEGVDYDIVIFQKIFKADVRAVARSLKRRGVVTVLDININILDLERDAVGFTEEDKDARKQQREELLHMLNVVDHVLTSSENLLIRYKQEHQSVFLIEEGIINNFFHKHKKHNGIAQTLLYNGHAHKALELKKIEDVLVQLHREFQVELAYVSQKDPEYDPIPTRHISYGDSSYPTPEMYLRGDIKIAPRDLTVPYNLGHSFNKVAYPMSVGLPAVASAVPSYVNRTVLLCNSEEDWYNTLKELIKNPQLRNLVV